MYYICQRCGEMLPGDERSKCYNPDCPSNRPEKERQEMLADFDRKLVKTITDIVGPERPKPVKKKRQGSHMPKKTRNR